ncbi:Ribosomal protein S18 acetylase RimI [Nocardia amikacinitolerans]|uniref:Ribosomal protein S18 acetylase RimI n=1 Tax=Nocardia amikacinitolerans TaxID=756689 RepID=A0A285L666_9NOCA|nr:GNAT family N-acetyltransferase [Nocardia amikacinitolerans]MCP2274655.1 Ribosomal protein S18 acetylase RimI [Nocardia amikacinitolerans]MCP2321184.1 Ribosomal protein S18 acetylase RimI [Nocardia amikacinitolerans]SNY80440.1 Ribosomal protein S18 acetylase RimI [Nocardia amikacinitolerans]
MVDSRALEPLEMVPATTADAAPIIAMRDGLARWMVNNGIAQWLPGEYPVAILAREAARGEWYVRREPTGEVLAAVRLIWHDPDFWGPDEIEAGYVHGLMVAPGHRGRSLGARALAFCAERTLARGLDRQRLDTAADNRALRKYYAAQGFTELRETTLPPQFHGTDRVVLMEKLLS